MHVHVVQKGDTLWKISRQYGVSFDEVKRLNAHLANPDYVVPGMKIFVPEKAVKKQENYEHPFYNDRPVKNHKEEVAPPTKKTMTQPVPQPVSPPKSTPTPKPLEMPQQMPQPQPNQMLQPQPQHMQQPQQYPYPYPISQDISMTNIMPPIMSMPYGWMPVPDVDAAHIPQPIHQKPTPMPEPMQAPKSMPAPKPPSESMPKPEVPKAHHVPSKLPTKLPGWKLQDSSSIGYDESTSLDMPVLPQYTQMQQASMETPYKPCGCGQPQYNQYTHSQAPSGCADYYQPQHQYPNQTLGVSQDPYMQMPQNQYNNMMPPHMMAPQMMPYMACTPCHAWQAPQGQWGYHSPVRYN